MKKVASLLKRRFENIITYLTHPITNATSESINASQLWAIGYNDMPTATSLHADQFSPCPS